MDHMVDALCREIGLRAEFLKPPSPLKTVYFGGGTPSMLRSKHLDEIFETIHRYFKLDPEVEITLEANPDDLSSVKLKELAQSPVNRLSIGVQSFNDDELVLMGRSHDSNVAIACVENAAKAGFDNITIDLIYGVPGSGMKQWTHNLNRTFSLPIQHLSCYGMTIEPRTKLHQMVAQGILSTAPDEVYAEQFGYLMDQAIAHGFEHYEISNFAKPGFRSGHNSRYWNDSHYLGIGPSAHSYDGTIRQWNVSSNAAYMASLAKGIVPSQFEQLSQKDKYNEFVMTRLRTIQGVDVNELSGRYGAMFESHFRQLVAPYCESGAVIQNGSRFYLSRSGQFIADKVSSDLFMV